MARDYQAVWSKPPAHVLLQSILLPLQGMNGELPVWYSKIWRVARMVFKIQRVACMVLKNHGVTCLVLHQQQPT